MPNGIRWIKSVLFIFRSYVYRYGVFLMFPRNERDLEELLQTNNQILLDIRDLFSEEMRQFRHTVVGYYVTLFTVVIIWLFWFQK